MKGIYKILNIENNKFYIGGSENIEKRWKRHLRDLKQGIHHNCNLQKDFIQFKEGSFNLIILKECNMVKQEEQKFLNSMDWSLSYNIGKNSSGGDTLTNHPNRELLSKNKASILNTFRDRVPILFGKDNPNWKGGVSSNICKCGNKMSYNAEKCIKCSNKKEENPFFNKKHSEKTKSHLSKVKKEQGYIGNQEVKVYVEGKEYKSVSEAGRQLEVTPSTIINRIKNPKFKNYKYK